MSAAASVIFIYSLYFSRLGTFASVTARSTRMGSIIGRLRCLYSADRVRSQLPRYSLETVYWL
jgi:hypothetical protein